MTSLKRMRGREKELKRLLDLVDATRAGSPQLAVVSGLRRVGKTFLLQHLSERMSGCRSVYFEATEASERDQLRRFTQALSTALGDDSVLVGSPLPDWENALRTCELAARSEPLIVMIDEATYLMESTPGFASIVQATWDRISARVGAAKLMIVLSGSAVGIMEDALSHKGALYQRPTAHIALRPFTTAQAFAFAGRPDPVALLEAYAACGGYPLHLDAWDFSQSTDANLIRLAGEPGGILLEDASLLFASLPLSHRKLLIAVGQGRSKRSELQNEVGGRIDRPLEALVASKLLTEARPLNAPLKARPVFRVADQYLRFWIRILANRVQQIEAGQGQQVLKHTTGEWWQNQLGSVFEEAAREDAVRLTNTHPEILPADTITGEWWSAGREQCQVDVLGMREHKTIMLGEARWKAQPLGRSELHEFGRKLQLVPDPVPDPVLVLWGRSGVRSDIQVGKVYGFSPSEMFSR
ncbi:MAG: ATP-binding protein [Acidimicrobiales bacterium]